MALNIRNRRAEELAEALTRLTEETKTQAVVRALHERLEWVRRQRSGRSLSGELDDIALHCASLPVLDDRKPRGDSRVRREWSARLMVIDTSALVAIFLDDPERRSFNPVVEAADRRAISAASFRRPITA